MKVIAAIRESADHSAEHTAFGSETDMLRIFTLGGSVNAGGRAMHETNGVTIRSITVGDVEGFRQAVGIVARERAYIRLTETPELEGASAFVRGNIARGNPQFVAEYDGEIIGWCDIVREEYEAERHSGSLGIGIIPEWRERGIGGQLIEAALKAADVAEFSRVELTVNADNERAIRLYQRFGFVEEGRKRAARLREGRFGDVLLMARLFAPPSH